MLRGVGAVLLAALLLFSAGDADAVQKLSRERMVFQTDFGDIHMAFYPEVAPKTVAHIRRLAELGGYNTDHFFRVDKGFVAQVADVTGGRSTKLSPAQQAQDAKRVPLEVVKDVKHDKRGILSMARHSDPNSGGSSFSILLGPAPHLDMEYAVFGEVTDGFDTLDKMEALETRREGIFVMPKERVTISSTYVYLADAAGATSASDPVACTDALADLQLRYEAQARQVEKVRQQRLPG